MKTELAPKQPRRTIVEQQTQFIVESQSCGFTRKILAHPQESPLSIREKNSSPQAALERLLRIAMGESGQCRIVGNFLLAWWNAAEYGGFDLTDMWAAIRHRPVKNSIPEPGFGCTMPAWEAHKPLSLHIAFYQ